MDRSNWCGMKRGNRFPQFLQRLKLRFTLVQEEVDGPNRSSRVGFVGGARKERKGGVRTQSCDEVLNFVMPAYPSLHTLNIVLTFTTHQ